MRGSPAIRHEHLLALAFAAAPACFGDYVSLADACGDGQRGIGEVCDDGNAVEGDGCNNDCTVSASEVWTRCIESFNDADVGVAGVAFDRDGNPILLATIVSEEGAPPRVWTRSFDLAGEVRWTSVCCDDPDRTHIAATASGPVVGADGRVALGGRTTGESAPDTSLAVLLNADGDLLRRAPPIDDEPILALTALDGDHVFAVVERDAQLTLLGLTDLTDAVPWARPITTTSDGTYRVRALAPTATQALVVAGVIDDGPVNGCGWLGRYGNDGGQFLWQSETGNARYHGIAVDPTDDRIYALAMAPCTSDAQTTVHRYDPGGLRASALEYPAPTFDATALALGIDDERRLTLLTDDAAGSSLTRVADDGAVMWTAPIPDLNAEVLAVAADGRTAVGGTLEKEDRVDVCLRLHTP